MVVVVNEMTVDEARAARDELLGRLGGDQEALDERAASYELSEDDAALYDRLRGLNFLLGE